MLATSDEEFQNLVENAVERRRRFESGVMNVTLSKSLVADNSSEERKAFEHGEMVDVQTNSQVTDDPSDPSDEEEISYFSDTWTIDTLTLITKLNYLKEGFWKLLQLRKT